MKGPAPRSALKKRDRDREIFCSGKVSFLQEKRKNYVTIKMYQVYILVLYEYYWIVLLDKKKVQRKNTCYTITVCIFYCSFSVIR